jgi:hypothetical protein
MLQQAQGAPARRAPLGSAREESAQDDDSHFPEGSCRRPVGRHSGHQRMGDPQDPKPSRRSRRRRRPTHSPNRQALPPRKRQDDQRGRGDHADAPIHEGARAGNQGDEAGSLRRRAIERRHRRRRRAKQAAEAIAAAEAARKKASSVKGEWRDTGKFIKEAEDLAKSGDFAAAIALAEKAKRQGEMGYEQAIREQGATFPTYMTKPQ